MSNLKITTHYPDHPDYTYETELVRVNLDDKRTESILSGRGFIINKMQSSLKKDLKNPDGIYSPRFGQTLDDINPFIDRYKCECGAMRSRVHNNEICYVCGTRVKYVDDDFGCFGWIVLNDPYYVIHPNLYKSLEFLIGKERLINIITPVEEKDIDGHTIESTKSKPKDEPFYGIGMLDMKKRIKEILDFYLSRAPQKIDYYNDLLMNIRNIFTQSVPVYTTHLRPYKLDGERFSFEGTNSLYYMMTKLSIEINNDKLSIYKKKKTKNQLLLDLQIKFCKLYAELEKILAGKKGSFRTVFGGRYNFTSRVVIVPNPKLRIDEVVMPYKAMVELLQQRIVNILQKSYNISYSNAYDIWEKSQIEKDERVYQIIMGLIKDEPRGIAVLINRNPTIGYGSIQQMFVVDICDSYTLGLPLQILPLLGADFDGDVLNVMYIINRSFFESANISLNPRNAMYISRNDGRLSKDLIHNKDTLINANGLIGLARKNYSQEQLERIKLAKQIH